jgi:DNA repair ATPase RecN
MEQCVATIRPGTAPVHYFRGGSGEPLLYLHHLAGMQGWEPALAELGIEPEDGSIILAREVAIEGRNVARINGRTFPVSVVRQVGDLLVDLHGQHEHQSLLREEFHLAFLDSNLFCQRETQSHGSASGDLSFYFRLVQDPADVVYRDQIHYFNLARC